MRLIYSGIALFLISLTTNAQTSLNPEILSSVQIRRLLPDSIKRSFNITQPVTRVYHYSDRSGQYYCVLTENLDSITPTGDSVHSKIRAINLRSEKGNLSRIWELNDFTEHRSYEQSIWFWTRYFEFKDYDKDSLVEPLVVYGTLGLNKFDDGRIKFLVYYKGQKIGIRYQGCEEDCRSITIDKAFYTLPENLQSAIRQKMHQLEENNSIIYPYKWEEGFKKKKLYIGDTGMN